MTATAVGMVVIMRELTRKEIDLVIIFAATGLLCSLWFFMWVVPHDRAMMRLIACENSHDCEAVRAEPTPNH